VMMEGSDGSSPGSWRLVPLKLAWPCYGLRAWRHGARAAQGSVLGWQRAEAVTTLPSFLTRIVMSNLGVKIGAARQACPAAVVPRQRGVNLRPAVGWQNAIRIWTVDGMRHMDQP
jgi:hypothetical protein